MCVRVCGRERAREQELCDTQRDNKGRDLAPRRPFISFSREVIPIDSYWTTSREALGENQCDLWRVARTGHAPSRVSAICSPNTNQLPNGPSHLYPSVQLLIYHFISLSSLLPLNRSIVLPQSHLPLPHPSFALPSSFDCRTNAFVGEATIVWKAAIVACWILAQITVKESNGYEVTICPIYLCVYVCVCQNRWMDDCCRNLNNIVITPAIYTDWSV